ncbi:MAG: flagellar type III secretion system pore protein FliP [Calditrichaeota bacterium]|nr:flagellar type III secretion system pore protein FliP [Calditrichota bacterium]MCB9368812.1 flagellar type III secretion system pore protein FliP [Calditrichota bacterium]
MFAPALLAQTLPTVSIQMDSSPDPAKTVTTLQIVGLMTMLALAPALVLMMTSFTRIIVVFHFLRQAMGAAQVPPAQLMVGLALILSFYIMSPAINEANTNALQPYLRGEVEQKAAWELAAKPFKEFMMKQVREKDLALFSQMANDAAPTNASEITMSVLLPAYVVSELRIAFQIGFAIYLPFLIIDMVVSSVLLAMGMMMLPPVTVSLPFKILLFVMVDGWYLLVQSLVQSFH